MDYSNDDLLSVTDTPVYNLILLSDSDAGKIITVNLEYAKGGTFVIRDDDIISLVYKDTSSSIVELPGKRTWYNKATFSITDTVIKALSKATTFDVVISRSDGTKIVTNDNSLSQLLKR